MGLSYMLNVIALPHESVPDWAAAEDRIGQLSLEDLDRYFDYWDPDGGSREEAAHDPEYVPKLRRDLLERLHDLRDVNADEVADLASKGTKQARRGRRAKTVVAETG